MVSVRRLYGMEGYGVYWAIMEMLSTSNGYTMPAEYEQIAEELGVSKELVKHIVEDHGLFEVSDGGFCSPSLGEEMSKKDKVRESKSKAGLIGMQSRWSNKKIPQSPQTIGDNQVHQEAAVPVASPASDVLAKTIPELEQMALSDLDGNCEWTTSILRLYHLEPQQLRQLLTTFTLHLTAGGVTVKTVSDYRHHLSSWIRIQIQKKYESTNSTTQQRRTVTRSTEQPGADF